MGMGCGKSEDPREKGCGALSTRVCAGPWDRAGSKRQRWVFSIWSLSGRQGNKKGNKWRCWGCFCAPGLTPWLCGVSQAAGSVLRAAGAAPGGLVVPVRTKKKKHSVPEWARELTPEEKEKRLRALVATIPEDRVERTFYMASTGGRSSALVSP